MQLSGGSKRLPFPTRVLLESLSLSFIFWLSLYVLSLEFHYRLLDLPLASSFCFAFLDLDGIQGKKA